jgi:hypothetical protein
MDSIMNWQSICATLALLPSVLFCGNWDAVTGDCGHLFADQRLRLYASVLYWKPFGDELDYLVQRTEYDYGDGLKFDDHIYDLKGGWDYGWRVGGEIVDLCAKWDLRAEWTHYNNNSNRSRSLYQNDNANESLVAIPFLANSESFFENTSERAHFRSQLRFHYDVIDLEVAHWYGCGNYFRVAPHFGLRTLRSVDRFRSEYAMNVSGDAAYAQVKNYFVGYGLKAGLDVELEMVCNLTLFGRASGSVAWGRTKLKHEGAVYDGNAGILQTTDLRETTREGRYIAELHAGISWVGQICEFYPLYFELAFDQTYLFNQHRFYTQVVGDLFGLPYPTYQHKKKGDLLLQGGSFTVGIEF